MPILILIAAAVALAMARKGSSNAATGGRRWAWDPERWRRTMGLRLHERRRLIWDPIVNGWASSQEMDVASPSATTWVPATALRPNRVYRFSGTRPTWMAAQALPGALNGAGWQVRRLWHVGNPGMPTDYPVGGNPDALTDPYGYVAEASWRGGAQAMQEGIEAPVEYVTAGYEMGFLPGYEMGADSANDGRHPGCTWSRETSSWTCPRPGQNLYWERNAPARARAERLARERRRHEMVTPHHHHHPHGAPPPAGYGPPPPRSAPLPPAAPRFLPPAHRPWHPEPWRHHHHHVQVPVAAETTQYVQQYAPPVQTVYVPQQQQVVEVPQQQQVVEVPVATGPSVVPVAYPAPTDDGSMPDDGGQPQDAGAPDGGAYDPGA